MPDQYVTTTTKGYGSRIMDSIKGVFLGFLLFVGSFGVLYWNEGRVDMSNVAKKAEHIESAAVATDKDGAFVSTTGTVFSSEQIGDGLYLKPGNYLVVERAAEMYAWVEQKKEETKTNTGGSETTTTTYNYVKEWTSNPQSSSSFKIPDGHTNPAMTATGATEKVSELMVGAYKVDGEDADLPGAEKLELTPDLVNLPDGGKISEDYIYLGYANPSSPQIGNQRVRYSVLESGFNGTVFGEVDDGSIVRYTDEKGNSLYRVFEGGRDEAIAKLHGEFVMMLWIFRLVGFLMMWGGMMMVLAPISVVLSVLPILGSLGKTAASFVTFPIALVLSIITILVSMILHSLLALIIVIAVALGALGFLVYKNKDRLMSMAR